MRYRDRFIAEMFLREGATAIYIEKPIIAYVRVSEVCCFDDHMQARITAIPTPGMIQGSLSSCTISAAWDNLSHIDGTWHVPFVSWTAYFGAEEIQIGLQLAAQAAERGTVVTLREMRTALEKCQSDRWERLRALRHPSS